MPGLVDVHSHVGGSGDINEMVYQTNPELRVLDVIQPHNDQLKLARGRRRHDDLFHPRQRHEHGRLGP
jgi:imidazolonepropionase-like amidohydrolase